MKIVMRLKYGLADREVQSQWFDLPVYEEDLKEVFGSDITESDCEVVKCDFPFEYELEPGCSLDEMNHLYQLYQSVDEDILKHVDTLLQYGMVSSLENLVTYQYSMVFHRGANMEQVARMYVEQGRYGNLYPILLEHINYESLGEELLDNPVFLEVSDGVFDFSSF